MSIEIHKSLQNFIEDSIKVWSKTFETAIQKEDPLAEICYSDTEGDKIVKHRVPMTLLYCRQTPTRRT